MCKVYFAFYFGFCGVKNHVYKTTYHVIHDEAGVSFCYFNIFLFKLCTLLPQVEPDICDQ